jgi:hypothetical protein
MRIALLSEDTGRHKVGYAQSPPQSGQRHTQKLARTQMRSRESNASGAATQRLTLVPRATSESRREMYGPEKQD